MKTIVTSFILIIALFSCTNKKQSFPQTDLPDSSKILEPKDSIKIGDNCYSDFFIIDSLLILIANCDTTFFHVYDKANINLIKKFGHKGAAPHEFMRPIIYNTNYLNTTGSVDFYDIHQLYNKKVDFRQIISNSNIAANIESTPIDRNLMFCHEVNFIDEEHIVMRSIDKSEGLFLFYDKIQDKKMNIEYHPNWRVDKKYLNSVYYGLVNANPEKKMIMYASRYIDQILFYDLEGKLHKQYYFSDIKIPMLSEKLAGVSNEASIYSVRVYNTEQYSYVLRANKSLDEILKTKEFLSQILVFDWYGSLIHTYSLPFLPYLFCVDDQKKVLYAMTKINEEDDPSVKIFTYQL